MKQPWCTLIVVLLPAVTNQTMIYFLGSTTYVCLGQMHVICSRKFSNSNCHIPDTTDSRHNMVQPITTLQFDNDVGHLQASFHWFITRKFFIQQPPGDEPLPGPIMTYFNDATMYSETIIDRGIRCFCICEELHSLYEYQSDVYLDEAIFNAYSYIENG